MAREPKKLSAGDTIAIRLPQNTPVYVIDGLNEIKMQGGNTFSKHITPYMLKALQEMIRPKRNTITIDIPKDNLTQEQIAWIESPVTQQMIVQLLLQSAQGNLSAAVPLDASNLSQTAAAPESQSPHIKPAIVEEEKDQKPPTFNNNAMKRAKEMWEED